METKHKVIAIDFDGTLFTETTNYPYVGEPIWRVINATLEEKAKGSIIILWTMRTGEALANAIRACKEVGIEFNYINENIPEMIALWGHDQRKIFADEYWDDRAVSVKDI